MLLAKYRKENPNASKLDTLRYLLLDALPSSLSHTVNDGAPALADYIGKYLRGAPSETQAGNKAVKQYNIPKAILNSALATGVLTGIEMLANKKTTLDKSLLSNAAAVGSFAFKQTFIHNLLASGNKQFKPSFLNTLLLFGSPVVSGVSGKLAVSRLIDHLKKDKDK
jgi:hypothetical protein